MSQVRPSFGNNIFRSNEIDWSVENEAREELIEGCLMIEQDQVLTPIFTLIIADPIHHLAHQPDDPVQKEKDHAVPFPYPWLSLFLSPFLHVFHSSLLVFLLKLLTVNLTFMRYGSFDLIQCRIRIFKQISLRILPIRKGYAHT